MIIEISNNIDGDLDAIIKSTLLKCHDRLVGNHVASASKEINLSVAVVSQEEIKSLNKQYRQKDEPTDVLSFLYEDDGQTLECEIIVCPDVIRHNAREDGIAFETELKKNLVHGCLHNLGFEHGDGMFALQEEILAGL